MVESECGAVAVGRTYLLPPLSSGGALVVRPWLRFHIPLIGRVEGWRAGVARGPDPHHVSSPLHVARTAGTEPSKDSRFGALSSMILSRECIDEGFDADARRRGR